MENLIFQPTVSPQATPIAEIGSLARAVEAERGGHYVVAWQEALKAIALRPFHPEAYIQMASTAVAAGDPEAALRAAQRALALTPKWPTAQQVVTALERTLNDRRKQRKTAKLIAWPELPDPNREPRLSVCMIVKNEERFLGQCLASVKDIADELIVIDTGSTDRTVEIAREHGAQVGHFEWCDDFAAARNASIAPATGDWILFLDADEELSPTEKAELPRLLSQTQVSLYRLPLINTHQGEKSQSYVPRLFRNPPALMFYGCVHEGVLTFIEKICNPWQLSIDFCNLKILHHGYEPAVMQERNKIQRNHDLLRKAILENPNEFYFHMQLGLELGRMGKKEESFQEYAEALRLAETIAINRITPEVRETLLTQYSAYLIVENRFTEVIEVLTGALAKLGPLTASHLMVRARAYIHLKQPIKALNDAELAHSYRMNGTLFPSAINPQSLALEAMMAEVFFINQRYAEALDYFSVALKADQPELRTILAYSECLDRSGKTGEALEYLHDIILNRSNIPAIWIHGASLLLRHEGLKAVAAEWIAEAKVYHPENMQVDALANRVKLQSENCN
jgi:glycosyltransferase involved in cell wall biosynthesis